MHRNGHWEQEISHLPASPLSVQLSFFPSFNYFFFWVKCTLVLPAPFFFHIFLLLFLISMDFLSSCKQSPVWTLVCDSCSPLFLQEALIISVHLLYKQCGEITQGQMFKSQMFKSYDHISLGWEKVICSYCPIRVGYPDSCRLVTVQSERATKAAAVMRFVVRWLVAHLDSVWGVAIHFLRRSGCAVLWFVF